MRRAILHCFLWMLIGGFLCGRAPNAQHTNRLDMPACEADSGGLSGIDATETKIDPDTFAKAPPDSESFKKVFLRFSFQNGNILKNNTPFFSTVDGAGHLFKSASAYSIEYGWQVLGGKEWHQTCKYPGMGIGLKYLHFTGRNDLGHPVSLYGFYDGNFFRRDHFRITSRMAAGLAYGFTVYDPNDPLPNDVISTRMNAFAELGAGLSIRMNKNVFLEPGFYFNHFSNGNFKKPQRGINITSFSLNLKFMPHGPDKPLPAWPLKACEHRHELVAYLGMSTRQIEFDDGNPATRPVTYGLNYLMTNFHLGYNYELSRRIMAGGGFDFIYDGTNGQQEIAKTGMPTKDGVPFHDKIGLAIFVGWETVIDRLSVITSLGYLVAQTRFKDSTPPFEQRLGFKYHLSPHFFAGVNVRAYHFKAAKAVEFNIGYRIFL